MEQKNKYSFDMFYDYFRGCSKRELERKYDCSNRSTTAYCKRVMNYLFNNKNSIIGGNLEKIKEEVDNIIIINVEGDKK